MSLRHEPVEVGSLAEAKRALDRGEVAQFAILILGVALDCDDLEESVALCVAGARLHDPVVRGNSVLALGHLARRFGTLDRQLTEHLVAEALTDPSQHVRGQAESAADDIEQFAGWRPRKH